MRVTRYLDGLFRALSGDPSPSGVSMADTVMPVVSCDPESGVVRPYKNRFTYNINVSASAGLYSVFLYQAPAGGAIVHLIQNLNTGIDWRLIFNIDPGAVSILGITTAGPQFPLCGTGDGARNFAGSPATIGERGLAQRGDTPGPLLSLDFSWPLTNNQAYGQWPGELPIWIAPQNHIVVIAGVVNTAIDGLFIVSEIPE